MKTNPRFQYIFLFWFLQSTAFSQEEITDNTIINQINESKQSASHELAEHFFNLSYSSSIKQENNWLASYNEVAELFLNGKYIEALAICNQLLFRKDEINKNWSMRWMGENLLEYKARIQLILEDFRGADSTITELLCFNNHFRPSAKDHSFLFRTIVENQTIEPQYSFGLITPLTLPFFTNIRNATLHEDFDYSKSLSRDWTKSNTEIGFFIFRNFKNFSCGITPLWCDIALRRTVIHTNGIYQSELKEDSRFFHTKVSLLYDSYLERFKKGHTPSKLSFGPSFTFMKLRSSFGSITSNVPDYAFNGSIDSLSQTPSNSTAKTYLDLMNSRTKYNWTVGLDLKYRFYNTANGAELCLFVSYQNALFAYTNKNMIWEVDPQINKFYADSPTKMSYLQVGLGLGLRSKKGFKISSSIRYE